MRASFEELGHAVLQNGGVLEVEAGTLTDAKGAWKSGCHVRAAITRHLRNLGLHHLPRDLPRNRDHKVILYAANTDAGKLIDVALRTAEHEAAYRPA